MERKIILSNGIVFLKGLLDTSPVQVMVRFVLIDPSLSEFPLFKFSYLIECVFFALCFYYQYVSLQGIVILHNLPKSLNFLKASFLDIKTPLSSLMHYSFFVLGSGIMSVT